MYVHAQNLVEQALKYAPVEVTKRMSMAVKP
jgi:hypothetical protein